MGELFFHHYWGKICQKDGPLKGGTLRKSFSPMNVTFLLLAFAEICKAINYMKARSAKTRNAARKFKIHPFGS